MEAQKKKWVEKLGKTAQKGIKTTIKQHLGIKFLKSIVANTLKLLILKKKRKEQQVQQGIFNNTLLKIIITYKQSTCCFTQLVQLV